MSFYPTERQPTPLFDRHRRQLFEESAIAPDIAAERGYYSAGRRSDIPEAFADYQRRLGLVVPMSSPDGKSRSYQLKPDKPRRDGPKYETPAGSEVIVDVHPRMLEEVRSGRGDLWITEGAKKGDALTSRGQATLSLPGVWMWCVPKARPYKLKPCFDHVRLKGRQVYVVFDSDALSKPEVQQALEALVRSLEERDAEVLIVYLEDAPDGTKVGVDDYLAGGGTVNELKMLARKFEPENLVHIRLSRDEKLKTLVEDLRYRWWIEEWKGRAGHSDRDVALKLVEAAARCGRMHPDGLRVRVSWGTLQVEAKVARRTLAKALARLEERGFLYRDNEGRKRNKTGAFVLRAQVDHNGKKGTPEENVSQELPTCNPGGLPLRVPPDVVRLRWPRSKFTPKRGTVDGTCKVREAPKLRPRDRIDRLGKIRGAILDVLEVADGTATLQQIADTLHRKRSRDIRRRNLPMLEEAGIITVEGDVVALADDWRDRLEEARELGLEIEADKLAEENCKRRSRAFHNRHQIAPDPHYANVGADGYIEDLQPVEALPEEPSSEPEVSQLACVIRDYLNKNPADACQPPGWVGVTLWAYDLYDGKPTPTEVREAIGELGGEAYLRSRLRAADEEVAA